MRLLRGLTALLLWVIGVVLLLVSLILCVTLIGLPLGIPLLGYTRRIFGLGVRLMTSRKITHPVDELAKSVAR
jgi:hypothetical protein